jgi:hypothetical protein
MPFMPSGPVPSPPTCPVGSGERTNRIQTRIGIAATTAAPTALGKIAIAELAGLRLALTTRRQAISLSAACTVRHRWQDADSAH